MSLEKGSRVGRQETGRSWNGRREGPRRQGAEGSGTEVHARLPEPACGGQGGSHRQGDRQRTGRGQESQRHAGKGRRGRGARRPGSGDCRRPWGVHEAGRAELGGTLPQAPRGPGPRTALQARGEVTEGQRARPASSGASLRNWGRGGGDETENVTEENGEWPWESAHWTEPPILTRLQSFLLNHGKNSLVT